MDFQTLSGLTRQAWTCFKEVTDHVRRNESHYGVLQCNGTHIRGLTAEHARFTAELTGANFCNFAFLAVLNHLERNGTGHHKVDAFKIVALIEEPLTGTEGQ